MSDTDKQPLKLSFCIPCKGRFHHIKETLPKNLAAIKHANAEIVLLDYDSENEKLGEKKGDMEAWVHENFQAEIDSGQLRYAKYAPAPHFKMAHAKNMAHRLATGDVLCNLDADNVITPEFVDWLGEKFSKNLHSIVGVDKIEMRLQRRKYGRDVYGICGRIAVSREDFDKMGGYAESFSAWGRDDDDMQMRGKALGLKHVRLPAHLWGEVIGHSNEERTENMDEADQERSAQNMNKSRVERVLSFVQRHLEHTEPRANPDGRAGCPDEGAEILVNGKPTPIDPLPAVPQATEVDWASDAGRPPPGRDRV